MDNHDSGGLFSVESRDGASSHQDASPAPISGGDPEDRYTIGEVVSALRSDFPGLSVSKVRYLERRRLLELERTSGGYRLFSQDDIELLRTILTLQENEYLPLEVIKQRIDSGIIQWGGSEEDTDNGEIYPSLEESRYTGEEIRGELGVDYRFFEELVSAGVIGREEGGEFSGSDLEVARMAVEMSKYGIRPRHLRGIAASVDREVAMFKQVLNPELKSGDERRVSEAMESARHLASVDSRLKELIMSRAIDSLGRA